MIENNLNAGPPGLIEEQNVVQSSVKGAAGGGRAGRSNRNREKTQQHMASIDGVSVDDALKNVCFTIYCNTNLQLLNTDPYSLVIYYRKLHRCQWRRRYRFYKSYLGTECHSFLYYFINLNIFFILLFSRRGITPSYELVQIEGAIHEPTFRYRVSYNDKDGKCC